jgi:hypothetical protein
VVPAPSPVEVPSPTPAEEPEAETEEAPEADQAPAPEQAPAQEAPLHEVRYLVIANRTGQSLRVFVKLDEARSYRWDFAPGQVASLAVGSERLAASQAFVWAEAGPNRWEEYKNRPLVLVQAPYRAEAIGTFTFTFNS